MSLQMWRSVLGFFPDELRVLLGRINPDIGAQALEIRWGVRRPLEIVGDRANLIINDEGKAVSDAHLGCCLSENSLKKLINALTLGSLYALEEELMQGYITLPGGHRVGFVGHAVLSEGKIRLLRDISAINFRIAEAHWGIADALLPQLLSEGRLMTTLILAPPLGGKTTMLREIVRRISDGIPEMQLSGLRVGLIDERSEIAGCYQGIPQLDVGKRTDVLDACPKSEGVYLLLRAMNSQIIATDEIGKTEDFSLIEDIANAGVAFLGTAHARNLDEARQRRGLRDILEHQSVERIVVLRGRSLPPEVFG